MFTILFSKGVFVFCVLVVIVLILLAYAIKTANALKAAENKVRELDSDVDIALAKRYDLLTKQYAMVKTYMSYESENLITAIKLRKGMTPDEKVEKLMKNASDQINAVVEAYPELVAGKNIEVLQNSCTNAEEHIQAARRLYNAGVTNYNNLCSQFPSSVVAAITGHNMVESRTKRSTKLSHAPSVFINTAIIV